MKSLDDTIQYLIYDKITNTSDILNFLLELKYLRNQYTNFNGGHYAMPIWQKGNHVTIKRDSI